MIALIHGDDTTESRNKLVQVKQKYKDAQIVFLDGRTLTMASFVTVFDTQSLFQIKKILIIEKFFTGIVSKEKTNVLTFLIKNEQNGAEVIFWEDKKLDKIQMKKLGPNVKVLSFDLPPLLFKFLDSIGVAPAAMLIPQFHLLLKQKEAEFIFVMILRQVRNLIIAKDLGPRGFGTMPSWQSVKFLSQVSGRTLDELIIWYRKLLLIDYQVKTGQTPLDVSQLLDIFLVSI